MFKQLREQVRKGEEVAAPESSPPPPPSPPDPRDAPSESADLALWRIWYYDPEITKADLTRLRDRFHGRWGYFPTIPPR